MRRLFADCLLEWMKKDDRIWVITMDLGYKLWDEIRDEVPDRFLNTGAVETAAMSIAVGLALKGKIPFVFSITPFLLWRPAETIRLYVDHENIPVKMIASGRNKDYAHDGFSHDASDAKGILDLWPNVTQLWPEKSSEIPSIVKEMIETEKPYYLNLTRK